VANELKTQRTTGRPRDPRFDQALIDAVLDEVAAGATLGGLSLVIIADTAGVSRNSLYRRWKTKDALYLDVLEAINRPIPELTHTSASEDAEQVLAVLIERVLDRRASSMLRALDAEAGAFPGLHRRYFREIVAPRHAAMKDLLKRGVQSGELRDGIDLDLLADVLVAPILARMANGNLTDLDPEGTSRQIVALIFAGAAPPKTNISSPAS
jgi:AcrR family transcriptional regulator